MCGNGCGLYYHGNTKCGEDMKDITENVILMYVNSQCPKCKQYLEKVSGCNHMTCVCKTQYCNKCGNEYQKDLYGHYMVTEHHRDNCQQYSDTSNIILPTLGEIKNILENKQKEEIKKTNIFNTNRIVIRNIVVICLWVSCLVYLYVNHNN
jgi:hypothetical protein